MQETRGIILFNRGDKCVVRAMVCLYTLRQHYDGPITFFLEDPYPHEFDEVCKYFNCDVVHNEINHNIKALVRKTEMFLRSPYDRTLWLDADMIIVGKLDEMFDYLDDYDVAIPHFAGWVSDGSTIAKRIKRYKGLADQKHIDEALKHHPAVNTGILSWRKGDPFIQKWFDLALKGDGKMFIPDEVAFQVLYPSYKDLSPDGKGVYIASTDFNVSVIHDKNQSKNRRVIHYHGQKHVLDHPNCDLWKETFEKMRKDNIANINQFIQYADKRLKKYIEKKDGKFVDTTIVTACDEYYVDILALTFPNWRKYKNIDAYPVIVFVHGMDVKKDPRLDFLRLPNVRLIPWSMPEADNHREEMLSAFVFGTAENVGTDYWMKLDADSFATDDRPFITEKMKQYAFCGHRWGYSRPDHIKQLDAWAKGHWKRKLKKASPMINEGRIEGRRFYHNVKRTISFVQLHRTRFTKFCVKLLRERKLPAPTQDTFMFFVANRFDPETVGRMNFKKHYGFTQGKGKRGAAHIKEKLDAVEEANRDQTK